MNFASQTAASLLAQTRSTSTRFSSGCTSLDELLSPRTLNSKSSSGLARGSVLELLGPPGIGKSKTALGFVINARFEKIGNDFDQVLLVDAEGSLSPTLIRSTADAFAAEHSRLPVEAERACDGIHYKRVLEASVLHAFLLTLPNWLNSHPEVKLIVLDSLSSHFRPTNHDVSMKAILSALVKSTLALITASFSVSVIITTQLSVKVFTPEGELSRFTNQTAEALLVPQLGDSWISGHFYRILLYYDLDGNRLARLMDAYASTQSQSARFGINAIGSYTLS